MLSLSMGEILVIAALALIVVGPERLPRVMRYAGRQYGQLRRAADDMRRAFVLEADRQDAEERYQALKDRREALLKAREAAQAATGGDTVPHELDLPAPRTAPPAEAEPPDAAPPEAGPR